jgi:hypothetical protein
VIASVAIAAECGDNATPDSTASSTVPMFGELDAPPDVILRAADHTMAVAAFGFHTPTAVADGTTLPPGGPDVVIETTELVIENSPPGWTFAARFTAPSDPDEPGQTLGIEALDGGRFRLLPPPAAGTYDIWLEGTNNGSAASYVFRWIHEVPPRTQTPSTDDTRAAVPTPPTAKQPSDTPRPDVYEAVIRHLAGAEPFEWNEVVIVDDICSEAGEATGHTGCVDELASDDQAALVTRLSDLAPTVRFVDRAATQFDVDWVHSEPRIVLWLGPIEENGDNTRVAASFACGGTCGAGATWVLQATGDGWRVTGSIGGFVA